MTDEKLREIAEKIATTRADESIDGTDPLWLACGYHCKGDYIKAEADALTSDLPEIFRVLDQAGFTVVPKEPTEEMRVAGEEAYWAAPKDEDACTAIAAAYRAMLAKLTEKGR